MDTLFRCRRCGHLASKGCKNCWQCPACGCACQLHACGKAHPVAWTCRRCGQCRYCKCRNIPHIMPNLIDEFVTNNITACKCQKTGGKCSSCRGTGWIPTYNFNSLERALGIEVELSNWRTLPISNGRIYNTDNKRIIVTYDASYDSSVQPSQHEIVTHPMSGDHFVVGILALTHKLISNKCEINQTCGLHVHVNGVDLSSFDLRRLLLILEKVEDTLYRMCKSSRKQSRHCWPLMGFLNKRQESIAGADSPSAVAALVRLKSNSDIKKQLIEYGYYIDADDPERLDQYREAIRDKYGARQRCRDLGLNDHTDNWRYAGVNLHSYFYRGSIEFRMKEGTLDPQEITLWSLLCGWIVEAASRLTDNAVHKCGTLKDILGASRAPQSIIDYALE